MGSKGKSVLWPASPARHHKKLAAIIITILNASATRADEAPNIVSTPPPPPAPLRVFGADMPSIDKFVLSIAPSFVRLSGTRIGTQSVWSEYVAATTPWFFDPTKKVRFVPQVIVVASQTVGLAYGVTKDFAIFATAGMIQKNLDILTFRGATGINRLGMSYTGTSGLTDFTAAGVYRVYQGEIHRIQINLGMAFPTGSNQNTYTLLQPEGFYATNRAFYALQPGTGTYDVLPGVVYAGHFDKWSWGLAYRGRLPLAANPQGYRYGDLHEFHGWTGYSWIPGFTTAFRVTSSTQGAIRGFDPQIRAKGQAANPNRYGGQRVELFGDVSVSGKFIGLEALSIAIEAGLPVYQNLNGPQISKNWQAGMALRFKI